MDADADETPVTRKKQRQDVSSCRFYQAYPSHAHYRL